MFLILVQLLLSASRWLWVYTCNVLDFLWYFVMLYNREQIHWRRTASGESQSQVVSSDPLTPGLSQESPSHRWSHLIHWPALPQDCLRRVPVTGGLIWSIDWGLPQESPAYRWYDLIHWPPGLPQESPACRWSHLIRWPPGLPQVSPATYRWSRLIRWPAGLRHIKRHCLLSSMCLLLVNVAAETSVSSRICLLSGR